MTPTDIRSGRRRSSFQPAPRPESFALPHDGATGKTVDPVAPKAPITSTGGIVHRIAVVFTIMALVAVGLIWRLAELQIVRPDRYVDHGLSQRLRTVELPSGRGDILDRNFDQLATSLPATSYFTDPAFVTDPAAVAAALDPLLDHSYEELYERLTADNNYQRLVREASPEVAEQIDAMELDGVFPETEPARFNPAGEELARSVIGRVDVDDKGRSGLEKQWDDTLAGMSGSMLVERDHQGHTIPNGLRQVLEDASQGSDIVLTLDRPLQFEVERLLINQVKSQLALGGVVVVSRPETGEILAMASVKRSEDGTVGVATENLAVTWAYEPGSIMKAITFASVLDNGVATPNNSIEVPFCYSLYDQEFCDIESHGPQQMTVSDIITESSNVGTVKWAEAVGATAFDRTLRAVGFGELTGLGLAGETAGLVPPVSSWDGTTLATWALGQGVAVSPVQMVAAYNTIANDGEYVPLTLVSEVVAPDGKRTYVDRFESHRAMSAEAAQSVRQMLARAVAEGTGSGAAIDGYTVAGKTGTARKPQPGGGYEDAAGEYHYVSSFAGLVPADDPELSILVTIDEPIADIYGGKTAAPVFADVARYALRHYNIPPMATTATDQPQAGTDG